MFEFMHHTLIISTTIYYYCRFMPQQQTTTWTNRAQFSLRPGIHTCFIVAFPRSHWNLHLRSIPKKSHLDTSASQWQRKRTILPATIGTTTPQQKTESKRCVYIYIYSCLKKMRFFFKSFVTIGTLSTDLPPVLTFRFFGLKQTHRFQCLFHLPGGPELGPLAHAMYKALCFKRSFPNKKNTAGCMSKFPMNWGGRIIHGQKKLLLHKYLYYCIVKNPSFNEISIVTGEYVGLGL